MTKGPAPSALTSGDERKRLLIKVGAALLGGGAAPARFSVALMDPICPPSGIFAAYNYWGGPKHLDVYPYNQHQGGEADADVAAIEWLQEIFA